MSGRARGARRLTVRAVPARALTEAELEELWTFYSRFVDRPKTEFLEAVRHTDDVFLGRARGGGPVRAFAAARVLEVDWQGRRYGIMYAAYGGIDPSFRGGHVVQSAGLATFLKYRRRHPLRPAYFVMMSSTYKSYLLMARDFAEFWPNRHRPIPERERALVDLVMRQVAGGGWDPSAGVVRRHGALRYREGVVSDDGDQGDPDIAFYGAMNPLQHEGDSLACIAPLGVKNWSFMAYRAARRTWRALWTSRAHGPRRPAAVPHEREAGEPCESTGCTHTRLPGRRAR